MYKYCLLFSGLQGEAEWSVCATEPSFVLCAPNDCQLGGRKPIREDRRQGWLLLAPQIALSLRFAFQSVHGVQLSCFQLEAKAGAGDKEGLAFLTWVDIYSQVVCCRLCSPTWKMGLCSNSSSLCKAPWFCGASKMLRLTLEPKRRLKAVTFPREKAGRKTAANQGPSSPTVDLSILR